MAENLTNQPTSDAPANSEGSPSLEALKAENALLGAKLKELERVVQEREAKSRRYFVRAVKGVFALLTGRQLYTKTVELWDAWHEWLVRRQGSWPEPATRDFAAALLARFTRMGFIALTAAIVPGIILVVQTIILWHQTKLLSRQNGIAERQTELAQEQYIQTQEQTRLLKAQTDLTRRQTGLLESQTELLKVQNGVALRQTNIVSFEQTSRIRTLFLETTAMPHSGEDGGIHLPNSSVTRQVARFGLNDPEVADALRTLLLDDSPVVTAAALLSGTELRRLRGDSKLFNARGSNLDNAELQGADLRGVDLSHSSMESASIYSANLSGSNLSGVNATELSAGSAFIEGTNFTSADLWSADFTNVRASRVRFDKAILIKAEMEDADLRHAHLVQTKLILANLAYARFTDADLSSADFRLARLDSADFTRAKLSLTRFSAGQLYGVTGLTKEQVSQACVDTFDIPDGKLPSILDGYNIPRQCFPNLEYVFHFEPNSIMLTRESEIQLYLFAEYAKTTNQRFELHGYRGQRGTEEYNLALSKNLASTLKQRLVEFGVPSERLRALGYGENKPLVDGKTREANDMNRRVEIIY